LRATNVRSGSGGGRRSYPISSSAPPLYHAGRFDRSHSLCPRSFAAGRLPSLLRNMMSPAGINTKHHPSGQSSEATQELVHVQSPMVPSDLVGLEIIGIGLPDGDWYWDAGRGASGATSSVETIALLTMEEAMEAMKKSAKTLKDYKPPSGKAASK